jgi:Na+-transporting NADH:ubiquinone oxidoreductase subunit D
MFSSKNLKPLTEPLLANNAITIQVLGVCSALAITVKLEPALVMGASVTLCAGLSCMIIACIRNFIPPSIRFIVQLIIISLLVIIIDQILKAYAYEVSKQLSVYVGLIITNCILMGRVEAYAMANKPIASFLDGIGNGAGYGLILVVVAFIRELLGSGTLLGYTVIPQTFYDAGYHNNNMVILPPMALIILGVIIWIQKAYAKK